ADGAQRVFLRYEEARWTFAETYREACRFANLFSREREMERPFHVGVLMDNLPAFVFAEFGCALADATLVGLNPPRTGPFLARDIAYADCQLVIVEARYVEQLGAALQADPSLRVRVLVAAEGDVASVLPPEWRHLASALAGVPDHDPEVQV